MAWYEDIPGYRGGLDRVFGSRFFNDEFLPMFGLKDSPQDKVLRDRMAQAQQSYEMYRPQVAQARMQAMQQTAGMMNPYFNLMEQMYGPGSAPDMSQVFQSNPVPTVEPPQPTDLHAYEHRAATTDPTKPLPRMAPGQGPPRLHAPGDEPLPLPRMAPR